MKNTQQPPLISPEVIALLMQTSTAKSEAEAVDLFESAIELTGFADAITKDDLKRMYTAFRLIDADTDEDRIWRILHVLSFALGAHELSKLSSENIHIVKGLLVACNRSVNMITGPQNRTNNQISGVCRR
jgi:hypothetical protein